MSNFTRLTAREITYNNFEISLVVFMPNITTNHAITYTNIHRHRFLAKVVAGEFLAGNVWTQIKHGGQRPLSLHVADNDGKMSCKTHY